MPRPYKLEVVKRRDIPAELAEHRPQQYHGRIKAGNGEIVFTTETMHNESDVQAALAKLVMTIVDGNFVYVLSNGEVLELGEQP